MCLNCHRVEQTECECPCECLLLADLCANSLDARYVTLTAYTHSELHTLLSCILSLLANFMVEHCRTDDLMPNVPVSCLPPSRVDPEVQELEVIVYCPQPGSSWATYGPPPITSNQYGLSAAAMTLV